MPEPPERSALYRLFDVTDQLLYVGISTNPEERWKTHTMLKSWWNEVAHKTVTWLPSWDEALAQEERVIRDEAPRYNGTHNYPLAPFTPAEWPQISVQRGKTEALVERIRQEIHSGRWLPGQRIPTCQELADATGVSRTTANFAIRALQQEDLLLYLPGFGLFVYDGTDLQRPNRVGR
ncbi:GntR family transcriptional regulator [Streptomyces massasporeus]|uniref:GntR family transcriptional regulator n=1 Tax=Streptomyces massasporeus TaxID=67324 RepID=UPI003820034C